MPAPSVALTTLGLAVSLACAAFIAPVAAQVRTDGSVGPAASTLTGPAYLIPQALGRLSGANLFHSFAQFDIGTGESATFVTTTPGIANVISRVTGGSPSRIQGLLRLRAADGTPGFFFINPAGVTFGPGAEVDVPGAFRVGTADAVVFPDGRFHADLQKTSSFSAAAPEAFGFLGSQRAAVRFEPGVVVAPRRGQAFDVAAGDLHLDGAALGSGAGSIRLTAVGGEAIDVPLAGPLPSADGRITLVNGATVASSSIGELAGAPISLSAGHIELATGSFLYSTFGRDATGRGGAIDLQARERLSLSDGASISSDAGTLADAGDLRLRAGELQLSGGAYLYSSASGGGRSGLIDVTARGAIGLAGEASISTDVAGTSSGQGIRLQSASLTLRDGAYVRANGAGSGSPGNVTLAVADRLALSAGAYVATNAAGSADAGRIDVHSGSLALDAGAFIGSLSLPGASGRSGTVEVVVAGDASVTSGASLQSSTATAADGGLVRLSAANLLLDGGSVRSNAVASGGAGASGQVAIEVAGELRLRNEAAIDTSTLTNGHAGAISLRARDVTVESNSRVSSRAIDGTGAAGSIDLVASGLLVMRDGASLSTGTSTSGNAGAIRVIAGQVLLEHNARIDSTAGLDSSGRGGDVTVTSPGALVMRDGATVGANTAGSGDAGSVEVQAGSLTLDDQALIGSLGAGGSTGDAGRVVIRTTGDVVLSNRAGVSSDAFGSGRAGAIDLQARDVTLDGAGRISSTGEAGRISIVASGDVSLLNTRRQENQSGQISTSTFSAGNGGAISIRAANVMIDGPGAGVVSFAFAGSSGQAGSIDVSATGELRVLEGGLSSSTAGAGSAGAVQVNAARVRLSGERSGLSAAASEGSGGQTGSVQVIAGERLLIEDGAFVSIANAATVADAASRQSSTLRLAAPVITLRNGAVVTAAATGNVAASAITVDAGQRLDLDRSGITTSANDGDGGPIRIAAGGAAVALRQSLVTTSVFGTQGDGGDIDLAARTLLMDTAFVQANTAARDASGGLVRIDAGALVASGNTVFLGGDTPLAARPDLFGYNVIQAAAPTGVSGVVELTSPVIDLTGSLRVLRADVVDSGGLGRSPCQTSGGSALALAGRGGLPASTRGPARVDRESPVSTLAAVRAPEPLWVASAVSRPWPGHTVVGGCL